MHHFEMNCEEFMKEYIDRSFVIGMEVELQRGNTITHALVKGINPEGELIVEDQNQKILTYSSGEITRMNIK